MEVFHVSTEGILLFQSWRLNSATVLFGACLSTFLITALYEGLKIFRQWLVSRPLRLLIKDLWQSRSTSEDIPDTEDSSSTKETLQQRIVKFPRQRRWNSRIHIFQTFLHMLQVFVGYVLMLIVMTYNTWLGIAVLAGAGVGYLAFSAIFPDNLRLRRTNENAFNLDSLSCQNNHLL
ncbi:protein SLC31A2-like isoform X2 [Oculina patagonica]